MSAPAAAPLSHFWRWTKMRKYAKISNGRSFLLTAIFHNHLISEGVSNSGRQARKSKSGDLLLCEKSD